ncbi:ABC transporter permease [Labrys portucalensis]|uniref:ABC transporter permease n=1 Tax=Labrys neptuniae TaxID=376174 RepID=A0ABV6ZJM3_9HYPH
MSAISSAGDAAAPSAASRRGPPALLKWLLPLAFLVVVLGAWEYCVAAGLTPMKVVPAPSEIWAAFFREWETLGPAWLFTLEVTLKGFVLAVVGGVCLAILFSLSRLVEYTLYPYAIILQVTPVLALAPLLLVIFSQATVLLICVWLVAFFPVLANTLIGLRSTDHNLLNLFELYRASSWQKLWLLRLRGALPYFLGGVRIAGGLSLIGAVVSELATGAGGARGGLGYIIYLAPRYFAYPRAYAALVLLSLSGIVIFLALSYLSHLLLHKWHESALKREN